MAKPQYEGVHRKLKDVWRKRLEAVGALPCVEPVHSRRCPRVILAGQAFDLPHDRATGGYREGIAWPACNRAEGARYGNRLRGARRARAKVLAGVFGPLS